MACNRLRSSSGESAAAVAKAEGDNGMRGNDKVIAELNEALREELSAINHYFVHAEMCHH